MLHLCSESHKAKLKYCFVKNFMAPMATLSFLLVATSLYADSIDNYIRTEMAERKIPAIALAVVKDGDLVKQKVYGLANVELNVPARPETVFALASITKSFVSAGVLQLIEAGNFSLDDSVTELLPNLPDTWAPVTVRHCLSHTSGLPKIRKGYSFIAFTREEVLAKLFKMPLETPGEKAIYNQTGYMVLSMIIEEVTGLDFKVFVPQRVLRPLGMENTMHADGREVIPGRASLYSNIEPSLDRFTSLEVDGEPVFSTDKIYTMDFLYTPFHAGAGFNSTIEDMVKWELAIASGLVLKPSTLKAAASPFILNNGENGKYGLGWEVRTRNGHRVMEHGGGWASIFIRFLDHNLCVIVLTNLNGSKPEYIAMKVASNFLPSSTN
jgi:CubicO group peptidase (beta-lactamase class C family)